AELQAEMACSILPGRASYNDPRYRFFRKPQRCWTFKQVKRHRVVPDRVGGVQKLVRVFVYSCPVVEQIDGHRGFGIAGLESKLRHVDPPDPEVIDPGESQRLHWERIGEAACWRRTADLASTARIQVGPRRRDLGPPCPERRHSRGVRRVASSERDITIRVQPEPVPYTIAGTAC